MTRSLNCPVCGAEAPARLAHARLVVCPHCTTSLFLEDDVVRHAGEKSALADAPSILALEHRFRYRDWTFVPHGRARFEYANGFWDEWWVVLDSGEGKWVSVDEGDIAVESPVELRGDAPAFADLEVGRPVEMFGQSLTVTEKDRAACIGVEGALPEAIRVGQQHDYAHLSGPGGLLMTLEYQDGRCELFKGMWIDPFELAPA